MKATITVLVSSLVVILSACAGGDPVRKDRFRQEEVPGGDGGGGGDPGASGDEATGAGAATSGHGASSGSGATGQTSGGGATGTCTDDGPEGNDSEATATDLGEMDDCDGSGKSLSGVLDGDDVDWFAYHGTDAFGCVVDPSRTVDAEGEYRVCEFVACDDSAPVTLTCPEGAWDETSPEGRPGCCSHAALAISPDCQSYTDSAKIFVRLDKPPAIACLGYKLAFHY